MKKRAGICEINLLYVVVCWWSPEWWTSSVSMPAHKKSIYHTRQHRCSWWPWSTLVLLVSTIARNHGSEDATGGGSSLTSQMLLWLRLERGLCCRQGSSSVLQLKECKRRWSASMLEDVQYSLIITSWKAAIEELLSRANFLSNCWSL